MHPTVEHPFWLLTLLLPLAALAALLLKRPPPMALVTSVSLLPKTAVPRWHWTRWPAWLVIAAMALLAFAAADPGLIVRPSHQETPSPAIIVCLDVSASMAACDWPDGPDTMPTRIDDNLPPDRLQTAKHLVRQLLERHRAHPVGLVAFARLPYLVCPLMPQRAILEERLQGLDTGSFADGTAIGDAIACALQALPERHRRQAAIVLLSDGSDHGNSIMTPEHAARQARERGIPIFTIGIGGPNGRHPVATDTGGVRWEQVAEELDEQQLRQIAEISGGRYSSARDQAATAKFATLPTPPPRQPHLPRPQRISLTPGVIFLAAALLAMAMSLEWRSLPK